MKEGIVVKRKAIGIFLLGTTFIILIINAGPKVTIEGLPDSRDIQTIKVTTDGETSFKKAITNSEAVKEVMSELSAATKTPVASNDDVPSVLKYTMLKIITKEKEVTVYLYDKKNKYYLERPYEGIYQLSHIQKEKLFLLLS